MFSSILSFIEPQSSFFKLLSVFSVMYCSSIGSPVICLWDDAMRNNPESVCCGDKAEQPRVITQRFYLVITFQSLNPKHVASQTFICAAFQLSGEPSETFQ